MNLDWFEWAVIVAVGIVCVIVFIQNISWLTIFTIIGLFLFGCFLGWMVFVLVYKYGGPIG